MRSPEYNVSGLNAPCTFVHAHRARRAQDYADTKHLHTPSRDSPLQHLVPRSPMCRSERIPLKQIANPLVSTVSNCRNSIPIFGLLIRIDKSVTVAARSCYSSPIFNDYSLSSESTFSRANLRIILYHNLLMTMNIVHLLAHHLTNFANIVSCYLQQP